MPDRRQAAYTPTSAAWRARRYLLLPIIPIFALLGLLVLGLTLSLVAIAIVWPVLIAYWIYVGLRLDRS